MRISSTIYAFQLFHAQQGWLLHGSNVDSALSLHNSDPVYCHVLSATII
jgi:hypothetical protein